MCHPIRSKIASSGAAGFKVLSGWVSGPDFGFLGFGFEQGDGYWMWAIGFGERGV